MITIKNLSFSYTKGTDLLKNINLNIPTGIYLSILGENGSCKSTLVKLILGLLKPDSGCISLDSNKIFKNKLGINQLSPNKTFEASYSITINS